MSTVITPIPYTYFDKVRLKSGVVGKIERQGTILVRLPFIENKGATFHRYKRPEGRKSDDYRDLYLVNERLAAPFTQLPIRCHRHMMSDFDSGEQGGKLPILTAMDTEIESVLDTSNGIAQAILQQRAESWLIMDGWLMSVNRKPVVWQFLKGTNTRGDTLTIKLAEQTLTNDQLNLLQRDAGKLLVEVKIEDLHHGFEIAMKSFPNHSSEPDILQTQWLERVGSDYFSSNLSYNSKRHTPPLAAETELSLQLSRGVINQID